jgi:hypothetical protein
MSLLRKKQAACLPAALGLVLLAAAATVRQAAAHRPLQQHELHEDPQPVLEVRWSSGAYALKSDADMEVLFRWGQLWGGLAELGAARPWLHCVTWGLQR